MSRPLVGPRLQRVLALVPWILAHPGVTLAELAARFEVSERELERDLELLPMCGLPPYTADRLIDVSVIDGEVEIRLAEYFERPLRLTPSEGLALLAAGRALLTVPGSDIHGPLATALDKLERYQGHFWEDLMFPVPSRRIPQPSLLRSHPPTDERVKRLLTRDELAKLFEPMAYQGAAQTFIDHIVGSLQERGGKR